MKPITIYLIMHKIKKDKGTENQTHIFLRGSANLAFVHAS